MPQSLGYSNMHIVFSTKDREPIIRESFEKTLYAYICTLCASLKSPVQVINGMHDHLHILLDLHRSISLAELVGKIKANSSRWAKTHPCGHPDFSWQRGYGYFSVGRLEFEQIRKYVLNQKEHHKAVTYQDELRNAFKQLQIAYDEQYVWD